MRKMTMRALSLLLRWASEQRPGREVGGVNVLCCDFVGVSQFCSLVIGLNYKLLRVRRVHPVWWRPGESLSHIEKQMMSVWLYFPQKKNKLLIIFSFTFVRSCDYVAYCFWTLTFMFHVYIIVHSIILLFSNCTSFILEFRTHCFVL